VSAPPIGEGAPGSPNFSLIRPVLSLRTDLLAAGWPERAVDALSI